MPRLSVLLPALNASRTIASALKSTLADLPRDSEIVVLDDGSTDETDRVIGGVRDRRVRVIRNESPGGVARGLQTLLESTDSDYVGRMDADDVTLRGRFRGQYSAVQRGSDVVFGGVVEFGSGRRVPRPSSPLRLTPEVMPLALLMSNPVAHSTMFARRRSLVAAGGYRRCAAEDYDLWLRLAASGVRLERRRLPVLAYRVHSQQVSGTAEWRQAAVREPEIQQSYAQLSSAVLGVGPDGGDAFAAALHSAVESTRGLTRLYLRSRLRQLPTTMNTSA